MAGPGGVGLPNPKAKKHQKMLVYGGAAGAALLLALLSRNNQAAATAQPADQASNLVPAASPASDGLGYGAGGGVDNSAQLASFETALLDQIPQAVQSGVEAGIANGIPAPTSNDGGQTPAGSAAGMVDAETAASLITLGSTLAGQQTGGGHKPGKPKPHPHPATGRGGHKPKPHPKPKHKPKHKPKPHPAAPHHPAHHPAPPRAKPPHVAHHPSHKHKH